MRVRFPSRNIEAASCPSFSIFDGSQDWVIVHNDVVAGSSPASGTKCRSSSVVEHVIPSSFLIRRHRNAEPRGELTRHDTRYLLCTLKRQLSKRELRRFGFRNASIAPAERSLQSVVLSADRRLRFRFWRAEDHGLSDTAGW